MRGHRDERRPGALARRSRGLVGGVLLSLCLGACSGGAVSGAHGEPSRASDGSANAGARCFALRGARAPGGEALALTVRGERFVEGDCPRGVELEGRYLAPAFIDAHVHLTYLPRGDELASAGVGAVVDLAAPIETLGLEGGPLTILRSGPMITAVGGYPTRSWGAGGYGLECEGPDACERAVDRVVDAGADLIKVPLGAAPELDDATLRAVVARAHARGRRVFVHALSDAAARRAADAGADVLAHTPVQALSDATVQAWSDGAVVSTIGAFGGSPDTLSNLRRLRAAGARVLYGTDLGNTREPSIDGVELDALMRAGLDPAAILAAGTSEPADYLGLDDLGALEPGREASFLVLDGDPLEDPSTLTRPVRVYLRGRER